MTCSLPVQTEGGTQGELVPEDIGTTAAQLLLEEVRRRRRGWAGEATGGESFSSVPRHGRCGRYQHQGPFVKGWSAGPEGYGNNRMCISRVQERRTRDVCYDRSYDTRS